MGSGELCCAISADSSGMDGPASFEEDQESISNVKASHRHSRHRYITRCRVDC